MTLRFSGLIALAALAAVAVPALADPVEIKFISPSPPGTPYNGAVEPWTKTVTDASNGALRVTFEASPAVANLNNIYDRVLSNVIQAGWSIQSFFGGQFPKTEIIELPLVYDTPEEGSLALYKVYDTGLIADEYRRIKVITVFAFPQSTLHGSKPVPNIEALNGQKVGAFGSIRSKVVLAMGAAPVAVPPQDLYMALSRGMVSSVVMGFSAFPTYKLNEVTKYHLEIPLGGSPGMVFMNKDVFDKLPDAAKKAIDANSGLPVTRAWATIGTRMVDAGRALSPEAQGHVNSPLTAADKAKWAKAFEPVYDEWIKKTPDGDKIIASFKAEVARVAATHKN